ncbi:Ig-like domain-containing protein [Flavobacterium hauense]
MNTSYKQQSCKKGLLRKSLMVLAMIFANSSMLLHAQTYCQPTPTQVGANQPTEPISLVQFGTGPNAINNPSSAEVSLNVPKYEDFSTISMNVEKGSTYTLVVKGNTDGDSTNYITIYIDWNQDGVFSNSLSNNEKYQYTTALVNSTGLDEKSMIYDITIPQEALTGQTRMRIVKNYQAPSPSPCTSAFTFGQVEDYTLNVTGAVTVSGLTVATQNNVPATITAANGTLQLTAAVTPANANQGVTWSITQGSAFATVSANGLVTATGNGTVTVTATSASNSAISNTIQITVSNQTTPAACSFSTVALTGFNADIIAEGTGGNANAKATQPIDGANAYYAKDFVPANPHSSGASAAAYGAGLPNNGTINSTATSGLIFQLAGYTGNNALVLRNSLTNTGTLTFSQQKKAQKVYVAWVSAEGANNVDVTVNFADGSSQVFAAQQAADWWSDAAPSSTIKAAGPLGRVSVITTAGWAPVNSFSGLTQTYLFQKEFELNSANFNKGIVSVAFTKVTSSNAATTTAILGISICETPVAPVTYGPVTISNGFNRDIIANGIGNASSSSDIGLDEVNSRALVSLDFKAVVGNNAPTRGLPADGIINSANTAGVTYKLANYTGANALYLTPSYVTGSINTVNSGTLSFQAQNVGKIYVLSSAAGGGSTNLPFTATVNFSDATTQVVTLQAKDWYSGAGYVAKGIGRVNRTNNNLEGDAENPRLYENVINLNTANQSKTITGISFSFSGDQSAEYGNEIRLAILSVTTAAPSVAVQGLVVKTTGGDASATINTNSGTLDLNAYQNDLYVADNDITWSIVPGGTGYANVGMYGVVTAVANGTVTVRATLISDSSVFGDFQLTISGQVSGYCEVYFINGCQPASISNFYTTGGSPNINNASSGCLGSNGLNGYSDYSSTILGAARNTTVTFNFVFTSEAAYAPYLSAWIDWNHDFIFQDSERVFLSQGQESDNFVQFTATVPANAVLGQTKMRFKAVGGWEGSGACGYNSFGEIEDYTITITEQTVAPTVTATTQNNVPAEITVNDGTLQLVANVTPVQAPVIWTVASGSIYGTIDANGLLSANGNGTITVKATLASNPSIYGFITITITNQIAPVESLDVTVQDNAPAEIITSGGELQLIATITPVYANNTNVTWSITEGSQLATVSATGLVTASANGTITVRATSEEDVTLFDEIEITISNQYVAVTGLAISVAEGADAVISTNEGTLQLVAEISPVDATNADVVWSIVNGSELAGINANGLVTALANGTVTVRATAVDDTTLYDEIEVIISNQYVAVTALTVSVAEGADAIISTNEGTLQLIAEITPADVTNGNVTWTIVNGNELATVDQNGVVTAIANGTVVVRATSEDNDTIFDEIQITISSQYVAATALAVSVADNAEAVITTVQGTLQLVAEISPEDVTNADVIWTIVSGSEFATVDENGLVTAIANGTVVIRATSDDNETLYDEIEVVINVQTAGLNNPAVAQFVLYPNPSAAIVTIQASQEIQKVIVFTITGQKVFESAEAIIDISAQQQGVYIVQVTLENGSIATQKLSKI